MSAAVNRRQHALWLVERDSAFTDLVSAVGAPPVRRATAVPQRFPTLIRSITHQLLATSAAESIHRRVVALCDGDVSVDTVLRVGADELKTAGLNRAKANAMVELAYYVQSGLVDLNTHGRRRDDEIIRELTAVKGIGPWTVQMYLMHTLARHDVWPVGDYGVRNGWSILHQLPETITPAELAVAGDIFRGFRSDVAWYCWQAADRRRAAK